MTHSINVCKMISIGMIFIMMLMSCATDPSPVPSPQESNEDVPLPVNSVVLGLQIESTPRGMLITFDDIPADTTTVYINMYENKYDGRQWADVFGIVLGPKLDEIKKTKYVICPFVKKDQPYEISVQLLRNNEIIGGSDVIKITPAQDATYVSNNIELQLNTEQTSVTLSSEPEFSASVEFDELKYEYILLFFPDASSSSSTGIYSGNDLTCTFFPGTINLIKEHVPETRGTFPAHAVSLCNIKNEGVLWKLCAAKTEEFELTL